MKKENRSKRLDSEKGISDLKDRYEKMSQNPPQRDKNVENIRLRDLRIKKNTAYSQLKFQDERLGEKWEEARKRKWVRDFFESNETIT